MNTPRSVVHHYMGPDSRTFFFSYATSTGAVGNRRDFSETSFAQIIKSKLGKEPEPTMGVLRMAGTIADGRGRRRINFNSQEKQIDKSFKHKAVCFESPGGSPVPSELIAKRSIFSH